MPSQRSVFFRFFGVSRFIKFGQLPSLSPCRFARPVVGWSGNGHSHIANYAPVSLGFTMLGRFAAVFATLPFVLCFTGVPVVRRFREAGPP